MLKFLFIFIACLMVLFTIELLNPVQAAVIQPFTAVLAWVAASVVLPFDDTVISSGRVLRDSVSGFAVSLEAGCNGVEASMVLLGFLAIQLLNILRIVSLFYLGQWNYDVFEWTHLYLWPVLIMLDVLLVFALYLRWLSRPDPPTEHA